MEVAGGLLIIWVGLGGRGGRITEVFFLVYFFNPAKVLEGHFYYGKAKVNVSIPERFFDSAWCVVCGYG